MLINLLFHFEKLPGASPYGVIITWKVFTNAISNPDYPNYELQNSI